MDDASVRRFAGLEQEGLREDILSHLTKKNGKYYFMHQSDGKCWMLEEDGLCRIQRNLDEPSLCATCRKYPRLAARIRGDHWISMAASCPVVAEYLWQQKVGWRTSGERGDGPDAGSSSVLRQLGREKEGLPVGWERGRAWQEIAWKLAEGCAQLLLEFREHPYFPGSFDYFEQEELSEGRMAEDIRSYERALGAQMLAFQQNYSGYRLFSRYLEKPEETEWERYCQIQGEILLMDVICFSCYSSDPGWSRKEASLVLAWVYRFCAHGSRLSQKVNQMFQKILVSVEGWAEKT